MFRTANYIEAALWIMIGVVFLAAALRRAGVPRRTCLVGGVAFALFGMSDVVEAGTGAWWRPWWLLIWKSTCVLVFLLLLLTHLLRR